MGLLVFVLVFMDIFFLIKGQDDNENPLLIKISNGLIQGREAMTVDSQIPYFVYEGIPYAKPPRGDLRFRAPVPVENWSGVLDATKDRGECTQYIDQGSEDCLYLNVYTTQIDPSNLLPVMVYIYGGYFLEGDSNYTDYGPDYFLDDDVIIVTLNYRLSVFGFLSTQDMAATGNWGLKDQILALKWVQQNIEAFGGNSSRVTIFGQSAGSASVSYLTQTHLTEGLFQQAIMESGTSLTLWSLARAPRSTAFNLGTSLGIMTDNSTYLVERLREVESRQLQFVAAALDVGETVLTNPRDGLIFAPCTEPTHKDAVVLGMSHENLVNGFFRKVPMIIGFNSEEGVPFAEDLEKLRLYLLTYDLVPTRLVPIDMNVSPVNSLIVALKIRTHYFGLGLVALSSQNLVQYITDDQFTRPITETVRLISKSVPVYFYRFSYMGSLGLTVGSGGRKFFGVGHGEEVDYLWRSSSNIRNPTKTDILTRRRLVKLWTNFAKTANPTPEPDPLLENRRWIPATPDTQYYLDIGLNITIESNLDAYSIPWWRELYKQYGNPPYDTY